MPLLVPLVTTGTGLVCGGGDSGGDRATDDRSGAADGDGVAAAAAAATAAAAEEEEDAIVESGRICLRFLFKPIFITHKARFL